MVLFNYRDPIIKSMKLKLLSLTQPLQYIIIPGLLYFLSLCAIFQYTLLPHQFCLYIIMCCFFYSSYFLFSYLLYCAFNYFTILQAFPFSLSHSFITYSTYIGILISPSWLSWHALFHHVLLCHVPFKHFLLPLPRLC